MLDEELDDELDDELELTLLEDELEELTDEELELTLEDELELMAPQAPMVVQVPSLPGTELVYQLAS